MEMRIRRKPQPVIPEVIGDTEMSSLISGISDMRKETARSTTHYRFYNADGALVQINVTHRPLRLRINKQTDKP